MRLSVYRTDKKRSSISFKICWHWTKPSCITGINVSEIVVGVGKCGSASGPFTLVYFTSSESDHSAVHLSTFSYLSLQQNQQKRETQIKTKEGAKSKAPSWKDSESKLPKGQDERATSEISSPQECSLHDLWISRNVPRSSSSGSRYRQGPVIVGELYRFVWSRFLVYTMYGNAVVHAAAIVHRRHRTPSR